MAALILDGAERGLIELLREKGARDNLNLTIYRSLSDEWELELSFDSQDSQGRIKRRRGAGAGPTFAAAWEDLHRSSR